MGYDLGCKAMKPQFLQVGIGYIFSSGITRVVFSYYIELALSQ